MVLPPLEPKTGHSTQNTLTLTAGDNNRCKVIAGSRKEKKNELLKWFWHRLQNFPWHFILEVTGWWQQKMSRLSYSAGISSHTDWATVTLTATTLSAEGKTALLQNGHDYCERLRFWRNRSRVVATWKTHHVISHHCLWYLTPTVLLKLLVEHSES